MEGKDEDSTDLECCVMCSLTEDDDEESELWVECSQCSSWVHESCCPPNHPFSAKDEDFLCPLRCGGISKKPRRSAWLTFDIFDFLSDTVEMIYGFLFLWKIYCVYYCIIRTIRPRLVQYYKMQWRANKYEVTKDEHEVHSWGGWLLFIWTSNKFQSIRGMHRMSKQGVFNNTTYLERRQSGCTIDGWERTEWLLI